MNTNHIPGETASWARKTYIGFAALVSIPKLLTTYWHKVETMRVRLIRMAVLSHPRGYLLQTYVMKPGESCISALQISWCGNLGNIQYMCSATEISQLQELWYGSSHPQARLFLHFHSSRGVVFSAVCLRPLFQHFFKSTNRSWAGQETCTDTHKCMAYLWPSAYAFSHVAPQIFILLSPLSENQGCTGWSPVASHTRVCPPSQGGMVSQLLLKFHLFVGPALVVTYYWVSAIESYFSSYPKYISECYSLFCSQC